MSVSKTTIRVGGIASKAWTIYRNNINTLLMLVAIMIVPAYLILALLIGVAAPEGFFDLRELDVREGGVQPEWDSSDIVTLVAAGLVGAFVALIAYLLATGASFKVVQADYTGQTPDWRASLGAARAKLGSLAWLALVSGVLLILAFLAFVIPAIYLWVAWAAAVPVLMTEDLRGMKALKRSRALVKGNWWPAFGVMLVGLAASLVVDLIIGGIFGVGRDNPSLGEGLTIGTLSEIVTQIIVTPFLAALAGVLYFELRRIKEGAVAGAVADPPPPPPAS